MRTGRYASASVDPADLPGKPGTEANNEDGGPGFDTVSRDRSCGTVASYYERGEWDRKAEFVLSCIGFSVGLGNVWRFPYMAFQNGGAAFLLVYLILQLLIGKPMYFMELCMGQFSGKGPTKIWEMNPAAKGIGLSMCLISWTVALYYNVIIGYTIYFFFSTMQEDLPWATCKEEWIAKHNCISERTAYIAECTANSTTDCTCSGKKIIDDALKFRCTPKAKTAAELFFYKDVIKKSSGIEFDQIGAPLWHVAICTAFAWSIVAVCLIKGIKSSGKVVYFTATFPYVILFVLLVRSSMLEGAGQGVKFFIVPVWSNVLNYKVWLSAMSQMFFSLSVSFGGVLMYGSYNKFSNKVTWDAFLISIMDMLTSVVAGFVVFTTFGNMAHRLGTSVENVVEAGYGMAFVAYPEALTNLPPTRLWSMLFFFMLFLLGLDSEFALMETSLTCIQDEYPKLRKYKARLTIGFVIFSFFMSLPCTTPGGDYIVGIMDHFGGGLATLIVAISEVISVMWIYGVTRFVKDMDYLVGYRSRAWLYWAVCLTIVTPITIGILLVSMVVKFKPLTYDDGSDHPISAQIAGWLILITIIIPMPGFFVWRYYKSLSQPKGTRLQFMFSPTDEWVPNDCGEFLKPGSTYHDADRHRGKGLDAKKAETDQDTMVRVKVEDDNIQEEED